MNSFIRPSILIAQEPASVVEHNFTAGIKGIRVDVAGAITIENLDSNYAAVTIAGVVGETLDIQGKKVKVTTDGTARVIILV